MNSIKEIYKKQFKPLYNSEKYEEAAGLVGKIDDLKFCLSITELRGILPYYGLSEIKEINKKAKEGLRLSR
jgi:hypothetical protein